MFKMKYKTCDMKKTKKKQTLKVPIAVKIAPNYGKYLDILNAYSLMNMPCTILHHRISFLNLIVVKI